MSTHSISSASLEDSDHYRRKGHAIPWPSKHYLWLLSTAVRIYPTPWWTEVTHHVVLHVRFCILWLKQSTVIKGSSFCRKDLKMGFISHTATLRYRTGYDLWSGLAFIAFLKAWMCYQAVVASWSCWLHQLTSRKWDQMEEVGHWRLVLRILSGFFPSWWPQANSSALSCLSIMMHFLTTDPQTVDGNFLNCRSTMSFLFSISSSQ